MCGIVAATSEHRNVVPLLVQGLKRLEYRGYDSCGVAVWDQGLKRVRSVSRVSELSEQIEKDHLTGFMGIAHTRWATHGAPLVCNAHPHFAGNEIALIHNGIIENYEEIRAELQAKGVEFASQTDTEVLAYLVRDCYQGDLLAAVEAALNQVRGAYAIAVFSKDEPHRVVVARQGSPLVLGVGDGEMFAASDTMALAGETDRFIYLEDGDVADLSPKSYQIYSHQGTKFEPVERLVRKVEAFSNAVELGPYRHYMQKEIFEQPRAIADTLEAVGTVTPSLFGENAEEVFKDVSRVLMVACGTSYYAALTSKYWLEGIAGIPCDVEIASEYRYRKSVPDPKTLVVTISQSGETADTLAALKHARSLGMTKTLTICNVATSAMVRESVLRFITRAGVEIGVASTKAFTTQLTALFLLTLCLAKLKGRLSEEQETQYMQLLRHVPKAVSAVLALEPQVMFMTKMAQTEEQTAALEAAGVHVVVSDAQDIAGVYEAIGMIGTLLGREAEAGTMVADMVAAFDDVAARAAGDGSETIYFEVSPLQYGLWAAGADTFMDEIAQMLGLTNAFADVSGWAEVSEEQVLSRDPDYIVTISMYYGEGPTPVEEIQGRAGWENVSAVKNGKILNLQNNELSRPSYRLAEGARMLCDFVYGAADAQ